MIRNVLILIVGLSALVYANANNNDNDSKIDMISCEPTVVHKCTLNSCEKIDIVNIDEVQYFEIDLKKRTLEGKIGEKRIDIENIIKERKGENAFVFFGTHIDSSYDWILRIGKKSGNMTLVSVKGEESSTIFGKCKWRNGK